MYININRNTITRRIGGKSYIPEIVLIEILVFDMTYYITRKRLFVFWFVLNERKEVGELVVIFV